MLHERRAAERCAKGLRERQAPTREHVRLLRARFRSIPREDGHGGAPMSGEDNLQRMKTLDDAWNTQNWEVFRKRHSADTAVFWPGQPCG